MTNPLFPKLDAIRDALVAQADALAAEHASSEMSRNLIVLTALLGAANKIALRNQAQYRDFFVDQLSFMADCVAHGHPFNRTNGKETKQ